MAVPFETWGALLEHGGWRQRLYEKRQGQQQQWSILQWMQTGVSDFAKIWLGSVELQSSFEGARGWGNGIANYGAKNHYRTTIRIAAGTQR